MKEEKAQPIGEEADRIKKAFKEKYKGPVGYIRMSSEGWRIRFARLQNWILIIFLAGMLSGVFLSCKILSYAQVEATRLGGMIVDNKVYDVKLRP